MSLHGFLHQQVGIDLSEAIATRRGEFKASKLQNSSAGLSLLGGGSGAPTVSYADLRCTVVRQTSISPSCCA